MAHRTIKSGYHQLRERLNQFPQGAPPSEYLYKILSVLMNEKEARVMSRLPIKPFSIKTASRALRMSQEDTEKILTELFYQYLNVERDKNPLRSNRRISVYTLQIMVKLD